MENNIRVVIDTNIWISFLIGKMLSGLSEAIINDKIIILFSVELFEELIEVLNRPKFQKYFSNDDIAELISLLHLKTEQVEVTEKFKDCRDPKDNFLLDLCVSGKADYLVTGDDDLLALNPFHGVEVTNYRSFQDILQNIVLKFS
ncbi:PIN domain-containing protein [Desulfonema limicola]|uniref:PIN domain-containing protein n=1 Tax=Desulfonema limicola TaxID=45656 RepID=A0A975GF34_9BACT|nr:putative toxin-antitoxin system toxin component, PIN family [Desulfonema limicola]QTA78764.1 PIN domain-containing protein [Desulfonema limicola]